MRGNERQNALAKKRALRRLGRLFGDARDQRLDIVARLERCKRHCGVDAAALAIGREHCVLEHTGNAARHDMGGAQIDVAFDRRLRPYSFAFKAGSRMAEVATWRSARSTGGSHMSKLATFTLLTTLRNAPLSLAVFMPQLKGMV